MMFLTTADPFTLDKLLTMATTLFTWVITTMGGVLNFITDNPVVLALFIIALISVSIGFLMRIWKSVG